jgi:uncharacterized protein (DUF1778 family)
MATAEKVETAKEKTAKQARLGLRLSEDQKARIERAAAMTGQTLNSFASSELLRRSDEILEKEEVRRLSDRDRDIFLALLDADGEPNEALKAAVEEYKKGRRVGAEYHFEL